MTPARSMVAIPISERDAEVVVDAEAGEQKAKRARITVPAEAEIDSPTLATARDTASFGSRPVSKTLSHPENEEQPVVGPGSEHDDDQNSCVTPEILRP